MRPDHRPSGVGGWSRDVPTDLRAPFRRPRLALAALASVFAGWAVFAPLSSAVIAPGELAAAGRNQLVQHETGGTIARILVRDGERVEKGDPVIELEPSGERADLESLRARRVLLRAALTRLAAQSGDTLNPGLVTLIAADTVSLRGAGGRPVSVSTAPAARPVVDAQLRQMAEEHNSFENELDRLEQQAEALRNRRTGLSARLADISTRQRLHAVKLARLTDLERQGYFPSNRLIDEQSRASELVGEIATTRASLTETQAQLDEIGAAIRQRTAARRAEIAEEFSKTLTELQEIDEKVRAARATFDATQLLAPASGVLVKLAHTTPGGVVRPGEVVAEIVPDGADIIVNAQVTPASIDQVTVGQETKTVITAFDRRMVDPVPGTVTYVAADTLRPDDERAPYYRVEIALSKAALDGAGLAGLRAGMQAESHILAEPRSFLSYVVKPFTDSFRRAFLER